jgi:N-methylhydantoinase B
VEVNEHSYPILVERYALIPESAGPGKWRGGHGVRKDIRVLTDEAQLLNLGERHRIGPPGLLAGKSGRKGETVIDSDGKTETIHSKGKYRLREGDVVSHRLSGGGGYGSPLERDPERVAADFKAGFLGADHVRDEYGVIVDAEGNVDLEATTAQRIAARNGEHFPSDRAPSQSLGGTPRMRLA